MLCLNPRVALAVALVRLPCACAPPEQRPARPPTISVAQRPADSVPSSAALALGSPSPPAPDEGPATPSNENAATDPDPAQAVSSADETYTKSEAKRRERQKQRAIALVHQLPEVKAYCREPQGCAIVEDAPARGCVVSDADKRACAWVVAIAHVEPSGPHLSLFARFYVRDTGQLFVEPIQTGEVVGLHEWRCLQKHGYDVEACAKKP